MCLALTKLNSDMDRYWLRILRLTIELKIKCHTTINFEKIYDINFVMLGYWFYRPFCLYSRNRKGQGSNKNILNYVCSLVFVKGKGLYKNINVVQVNTCNQEHYRHETGQIKCRTLEVDQLHLVNERRKEIKISCKSIIVT